HRPAAARSHRAGARADGGLRLGRRGRGRPAPAPGTGGGVAAADVPAAARAHRAGPARAARLAGGAGGAAAPPGRGHGHPAPAPHRGAGLRAARHAAGREAMIAPLNSGAAPVCGGAPGSGSGAAAADATPAASGCGFGARLEAAAPAPEAAGETTAAEAVEGAPVVVQAVVPAVPGGMAGVPAADVAAEAPLPAATVDQKDAATRLLRAQLFAVAEEVGAPAVPGARLHVWPQALPAGIPVSPVAAGAIPPIAAPARPAPAARSPPVAAVASYSVQAAAPHALRGSPSTPVDGAGQAAATAEANARAPTAEATGGAGPRGALPEGVPAAA